MIPSLLERLEQAVEGSRELDNAIFLATHPEQGTHSEDGQWWYATHMDEDGGPWAPLPHYTTSIDAALSLVPEGCGGALSWEAPEIGIKESAALVDYRNGSRFVGRGCTLALALCIAALRAREDA